MLFSKYLKRGIAVLMLMIMVTPLLFIYVSKNIDKKAQTASTFHTSNLEYYEMQLLIGKVEDTVNKSNQQHIVVEEEIISIFTKEIIAEPVVEVMEEVVIKTASNGKPYVYYEVYDKFYGSKEWHSLNSSLQEFTYELCIEYNIEKYFTLILCQLFYESMYDYDAVSSTSDYGIAQINKSNHKWLRKKLNITDFLDPYQSILCNIYMMSSYLKKYSVESSLFCYNTGKTNGSNRYARNIIYLWNNCLREIEE